MIDPIDLADDYLRDQDGALVDASSLADPGHGADCSAFTAKWRDWYDRSFGPGRLPAMIEIRRDEFYLELIGTKSRNMLRRADTIGFTCAEFDHDLELEAIYRINRSKPVRSGGPMREAYMRRPALIDRPLDLCRDHRSIWIGARLAGELRAYAHLIVVGELGVVNTILGEGAYLPKTGMMNALVAAIVWRCRQLGTPGQVPVRYLNYLTLDGPAGLVHFKTSTGFRSTPVALK